MQYTLKALAAAALIASTGLASAAPLTVNTGDQFAFNGEQLILEGGTGTLTFSDSLLAALNLAKATVTSEAPAVVTGTPGAKNVAAAAPIASVTADDVSGNVLGVGTTGGALITAPASDFVSAGGTLSVTNINVDLATKRIYASITGDFTGAAAGVPGTGAISTLDNFYLWDYATISGATAVTGEGTFNTTLGGLKITNDGYKHFVSALRLGLFGTTALQAVTDFGAINSTITVTAAVPEPSTYALAIAGLAMVGVAARRRARQA